MESPCPARIRLSVRARVLALIEAGRPVKQVAEMLGISDQTIYTWRRQHLIGTGQAPGIPSSENAELIAARRRIAELEQELVIHRRAAELLDAVVPPKGGSRPSR